MLLRNNREREKNRVTALATLPEGKQKFFFPSNEKKKRENVNAAQREVRERERDGALAQFRVGRSGAQFRPLVVCLTFE